MECLKMVLNSQMFKFINASSCYSSYYIANGYFNLNYKIQRETLTAQLSMGKLNALPKMMEIFIKTLSV